MNTVQNELWVKGNNAFTISLYNNLAREGENLVLSPFSVSTVLSMLLGGARGQTASEINLAIGYAGLTLTEIQEAFQKAIKELKGNEKYVLEIANSIWVEASLAVNDDFKQSVEKYFVAEERALNPETGVAEVNQWVDAKTNHKIPKLLDSLPDDIVMILVNAIYFKGAWLTRFDALNTREAIFKNDDLNPKATDLMNITDQFRYLESETLNAKMLELAYEGQEMIMVVILPNENTTLKDLESNLTVDNFTEELKSLRSTWKSKVDVALPKFKIESTLDLNASLESLGIKTSFSNSADFKGITETNSVKVSKVLQKALIEVNEEGSEAAAATACMMVTYCMQVEEPKINSFKADHPFVYALVHTISDTVLFLGRLTNI